MCSIDTIDAISILTTTNPLFRSRFLKPIVEIHVAFGKLKLKLLEMFAKRDVLTGDRSDFFIIFVKKIQGIKSYREL